MVKPLTEPFVSNLLYKSETEASGNSIPLMKTTQVINKVLKSRLILRPVLTNCMAPHQGQTSAPRLKRQSMEKWEALVLARNSSQKPGRCTSNNNNLKNQCLHPSSSESNILHNIASWSRLEFILKCFLKSFRSELGWWGKAVIIYRWRWQEA